MNEEMEEEEMTRKGRSGRTKEVSAGYKAESEDLKLDSKITGLSNETVERLKRGRR